MANAGESHTRERSRISIGGASEVIGAYKVTMGREIYAMILRVASGAQSKSEAEGLGDYEFVPWQIGATM